MESVQLELDEKLNAMDQLYVLAGALCTDYREFCAQGFCMDLLKKCKDDIDQMENAGEDACVYLTDIAQTLRGIIEMPNQTDVCESVIEMVEQLQQNIRKMYLACIHDENSYRKVKLENYYGTEYEKNALIIYIVYPFLFPEASPGHTNQIEVKVMAELLKEKGYNVDIVNTRYTGTIESKKYDLVIGSGNRFEEVCGMIRPQAVSLYYLTESSPYFANTAELKRLNDFQKRNHCNMPFERQAGHLMNLQALAAADAAICIGNRHTVSTYEGMFERIYPINATGFTGDFLVECHKKATNASQNFLWYGGAGPIHKGLDLCLEAFRDLPQLNLYIVGEVHSEFYDFYKEDIENGKNIYYYGFLNKDSEEFREVCMQCGFCISPSCSEGQSTSVITAMFAGLIPVCTPQTGIDMDVCGGIWIENTEVNKLKKLIELLAEMSDEEANIRRQKVHEYVWDNHTVGSYRERLNEIIDDVI